jgi:hypothetical protein
MTAVDRRSDRAKVWDDDWIIRRGWDAERVAQSVFW